jgi:hypothetical protein
MKGCTEPYCHKKKDFKKKKEEKTKEETNKGELVLMAHGDLEQPKISEDI